MILCKRNLKLLAVIFNLSDCTILTQSNSRRQHAWMLQFCTVYIAPKRNKLFIEISLQLGLFLCFSPMNEDELSFLFQNNYRDTLQSGLFGMSNQHIYALHGRKFWMAMRYMTNKIFMNMCKRDMHTHNKTSGSV